MEWRWARRKASVEGGTAIKADTELDGVSIELAAGADAATAAATVAAVSPVLTHAQGVA